jgi:hypothetical protein
MTGGEGSGARVCIVRAPHRRPSIKQEAYRLFQAWVEYQTAARDETRTHQLSSQRAMPRRGDQVYHGSSGCHDRRPRPSTSAATAAPHRCFTGQGCWGSHKQHGLWLLQPGGKSWREQLEGVQLKSERVAHVWRVHGAGPQGCRKIRCRECVQRRAGMRSTNLPFPSLLPISPPPGLRTSVPALCSQRMVLMERLSCTRDANRAKTPYAAHAAYASEILDIKWRLDRED